MRDLHELTRELGNAQVADAMGVTMRSLVDLRCGARPLTVDDLYELQKRYPDFDIATTVRRIGATRVSKGVNRRSRRASRAAR